MRIKIMKKQPEPKNDRGRNEYLDMRDTSPAWHLHDGSMRLYIVGSDRHPNAWFPVTAPSSEPGKHGAESERAIAELAVEWLRENMRDNLDAGPLEIRAALERFGWVADELTKYAA